MKHVDRQPKTEAKSQEKVTVLEKVSNLNRATILERTKISLSVPKKPVPVFNKLELIKRIIEIIESESLTVSQKEKQIEVLID